MTDRYFVSDLSAIRAGGTIQLESEESTHAVRVMRIGEGAPVEIFDGNSRSATGNVVSASRKAVLIRVQSVATESNMPDVEVEMLVGLPKPERCKELVARLTELGVRRIIPILCERTQRPPSDGLLEKLRRAVIEACKQCRRNELMQIETPISLMSVVDSMDCQDVDLQIAHPGPETESGQVQKTNPPIGRARILIGPEGGFTEPEVRAALAAGYRGINLGRRIYRIETAAVVAATLSIYRGERR